MKKFLLLLSILTILCCNIPSDKQNTTTSTKLKIKQSPKNNPIAIQAKANSLDKRFPTPTAYQRMEVEQHSFAAYLRTIPLKDADALVKYYNGNTKAKEGIYLAVVDLDIGNKNLHQCADAIMRLRAEHLWHKQNYDAIHFNFTNGFKVAYKEWMQGKKMIVKGNKTYWSAPATPSNTYQDFWNYMELIFTYAGTASLEKELQSVALKEMKIGDIFIQGGFPGHAVIVMDMAINPTTGKKIYMLAQSYMPAQEIQILINPQKHTLSPWYELNTNSTIKTPEWTFQNNNLKRFKQ